MKFYLLILPILIGGFLSADFAIPADQSPGGNNNRWGITTKEPVEDDEESKDEAEEKDVDAINNREKNLHEKKMFDREEDSDTKASKKDDIADTKNQTEENKSVQKKSIEERQTDKIETGEKLKKQKEKEALIKWKNETQKTRCNGYLVSLKESFLKARYYSIQGVPCGTAENARSFMTLIDNCKQDCPDGFLKKNGYTSRIIRNLSWLEKLGAERCPDMSSN